MFKNFDLIILTIILALVAFIIGLKLISMSILESSLIVAFSLFSIPLYKGCKKKQKKQKIYTFWKNYWHDMRCKIFIILYGIISAMLIVFIVKY